MSVHNTIPSGTIHPLNTRPPPYLSLPDRLFHYSASPLFHLAFSNGEEQFGLAWKISIDTLETCISDSELALRIVCPIDFLS